MSPYIILLPTNSDEFNNLVNRLTSFRFFPRPATSDDPAALDTLPPAYTPGYNYKQLFYYIGIVNIGGKPGCLIECRNALADPNDFLTDYITLNRFANFFNVTGGITILFQENNKSLINLRSIRTPVFLEYQYPNANGLPSPNNQMGK